MVLSVTIFSVEPVVSLSGPGTTSSWLEYPMTFCHFSRHSSDTHPDLRRRSSLHFSPLWSPSSHSFFSSFSEDSFPSSFVPFSLRPTLSYPVRLHKRYGNKLGDLPDVPLICRLSLRSQPSTHPCLSRTCGSPGPPRTTETTRPSCRPVPSLSFTGPCQSVLPLILVVQDI